MARTCWELVSGLEVVEVVVVEVAAVVAVVVEVVAVVAAVAAVEEEMGGFDSPLRRLFPDRSRR